LKKAIVIGATGMVGMQLIQQLIEDKSYIEINSLGRRNCGITHPKLKEYQVNFDHPESWKSLIIGDVLFSTLGTTLKTARSKAAQYQVDFSYQYNVAEVAAENGVENYVLISSAGAHANSLSFYLRMKGKLEEAISQLPFKSITILRPGQLDGDRLEKRIWEKMGLRLMYALNSMGIFKKYKPITANEVAKAMINVAQQKENKTYELDKLFNLID
jgi:uncharacterized protein YbjT (DUF2867 family)